jgi:Phosphatidylinositol-4-phosphate 5-Kinase
VIADPTNIHDAYEADFDKQMQWELQKLHGLKVSQQASSPREYKQIPVPVNYIITEENIEVGGLEPENVSDDDGSIVKRRQLMHRHSMPTKFKQDIEFEQSTMRSHQKCDIRMGTPFELTYISTNNTYFQQKASTSSSKYNLGPSPLQFPSLSPAIEYFQQRAKTVPRFSELLTSKGQISPSNRLLGQAQQEYIQLREKARLTEADNFRLKEILINVHNQINDFGSSILVIKSKYEELLNTKHSKFRAETSDPEDEEEKVSKLLFTDALWKVVITIMTGIKMSVKAFDFEKKFYTPMERDYLMMNRFEIHHPALEQYKQASFKDYAPTIFNYLRKMFGVFPESYIQSLGPESLANVITGSSGSYQGMNSAGQSGSFFFTSSDKKFLVKTIKKDEFELLMKILPEYCDYLINNKKTLLNRIYGLHRIIMKSPLGISEKFTIIVMDNLFKSNVALKKIFDLKGSTYGRKTK